MIRSLHTAAAGMISQQFNIDTISNNLANVNTTAFKETRAEFQDLLYQTVRQAGAPAGAGTIIPNSVQLGHGSRASSTSSDFAAGPTEPTNNPYDMAVQGEGFFMVQMPDGSISYTRDGSFKIDAQGRLVTADGYPLQPEVLIPNTAEVGSLSISPDGSVSVRLNGQDSLSELGVRLELARFPNPSGLVRIGSNLFRATNASGDAVVGNPGENGLGNVLQKHLEQSNVQVVEEMVKLIMAQRAYEVNAKSIQTADDMLGITNNLKR